MNSAKLLNLATTSGLGITSRKFIKKKLASAVPKECFGVFVSVHRSKSHTKGTNDVHGCIGFFDNDYKPTDGEIIIEKMTNVAYSATFEDSRKDNFDKPIYLDPLAKFEVIFMLTPLMEIDIETGKINGTNEVFDNNKYGIIVGGESRATYLPHVFEDITWIDIRNSLITKGSGLQEETIQKMPLEELKSRFKFFCYNAKIYSKTIFNALDGAYLQFLNKKIVFSLNHIKDYIKLAPELIAFKKEISEDTLEKIRNQLLFCKITALNKIDKSYKGAITSKLKLNKPTSIGIHSNILKNIGHLLVALNEFDLLESNEKKTLTSYLYENLDSQTDLSEALVALITVGNKNKNNKIAITKKCDELFLACENLPSQLKHIDKFSAYVSVINAFSKKRRLTDLEEIRARKLFQKITNIIVELNESTNTNYVAVCLEGLASLIKVLNIKLKVLLKAKLLKLIYLLETQRDNDGLIKFLDNSKRIDITKHVICGYKVLKDIMRQSKKSKKKISSSLSRKSLKKVTIN